MFLQQCRYFYLVALAFIVSCGGGGANPTFEESGQPSNDQDQQSAVGSIVTARTNFGHPDFHYPVSWYNSNFHPMAFHVNEYVDDDPRPFVSEMQLRALGYQLHDEMTAFASDVLRQMNEIYSDVTNGQITSTDPVIDALDRQFAIDVDLCVEERGVAGEIFTYDDCRVINMAYRVPSGGVIIVRPRTNDGDRTTIDLGSFTIERPQGWFGHGAQYHLSMNNNREFVGASTTFPFDSFGGSISLDSPDIEVQDNAEPIGQATLNRTAVLLSSTFSTLRGMRTGDF